MIHSLHTLRGIADGPRALNKQGIDDGVEEGLHLLRLEARTYRTEVVRPLPLLHVPLILQLL